MTSAADQAIAHSGPGQSHRRVFLLLTAATILYCLPLFSRLDHYGRDDWDQFTFRYETPRVALLRDHQLPLWNPYANGGTVLLAHPHCPAVSPWYLTVLALGTPLGLRVQVVLFMALGAIGMAALLRRWNVRTCGCFLGGVLMMMSSHFAMHVSTGHLEWCVLGLMPWLVLCLLRARTDCRFLVVAGLLFASVLTFGSVYVVAVYVPFLTLWVLLESIRERSWRFAAGWGGVLVLTALVSAVKLAPQLEFVRAHPRQTGDEGFSPLGLSTVFLEPRQAMLQRETRVALFPAEDGSFAAVPNIPERLRRLGFQWQWHEYSCYVTFLGLALAACGIVVSWRLLWPLYVAGLVALLMVPGNGSPVDIWSLMKQLPMYRSMQVSSRFLAAVVFVLAVAAGSGLSWLSARARVAEQSWLRVLIRRVIPAAVYLELAVLGWTLFGDIFVITPPRVVRHEQFAMRREVNFFQFPKMFSCLYPDLVGNSGILRGYENIAVRHGDVRVEDDPGYRGEAYLVESRGSASIARWTMSRVQVAVEVSATDVLVLNQNYFTGWRAIVHGSNGRRKEAAEASSTGLVSIGVRPGDEEVEFYYLPASFLWGVWISGISLTGSVVFLFVRRRQPPPAPFGNEAPG